MRWSLRHKSIYWQWLLFEGTFPASKSNGCIFCGRLREVDLYRFGKTELFLVQGNMPKSPQRTQQSSIGRYEKNSNIEKAAWEGRLFPDNHKWRRFLRIYAMDGSMAWIYIPHYLYRVKTGNKIAKSANESAFQACIFDIRATEDLLYSASEIAWWSHIVFNISNCFCNSSLWELIVLGAAFASAMIFILRPSDEPWCS